MTSFTDSSYWYVAPSLTETLPHGCRRVISTWALYLFCTNVKKSKQLNLHSSIDDVVHAVGAHSWFPARMDGRPAWHPDFLDRRGVKGAQGSSVCQKRNLCWITPICERISARAEI